MEAISSQIIEKEIKENNYKLLGQVSVSDSDYGKLVNYAKNKSHYIVASTIPKPDLVLSLALVQIAIKHYREGKYWRCFQDEIDEDISSAKLNYFGQIFAKTIKNYGLLELQRENNSSQMFVENIKAHAFITNYYMQGFYDFSYAFFENNLFRELSEDLSEDLESLSSFMRTTLSSNKDAISSDEETKKAAKSYKLLKSTRAVFAQCDIHTVYAIFYPILTLIDKYYYEYEVPAIPQNRFEKEFIEWCSNRQIEEQSKRGYLSVVRRAYSHKPYIRINIDCELATLVVPAQKFRGEDCDGEAKVSITINGQTETRSLELYKSFGIFISEEIEIPIPDIFEEIYVEISSLSNRRFHFFQSKYRIFNNSWESIPKFVKGHNYLLVKPTETVIWEHEEDLLDSTDVFADWLYFSANITEDSLCYVGNKPLSIIGEFSPEPIFDDCVENFQLFSSDDKVMKVTRSHPGISFIVEKQRLNGSALIVNKKRFFLKDIKEKNVYIWPDDQQKMAVNLLLGNILSVEDGHYRILLDIPGENTKQICEYILLRKFNCKLDNPKYIYAERGLLTIRKDKHMVYFIDENWINTYENEMTAIFEFPLTEKCKYVEFVLSLEDNPYTVRLPINIFSYGFSQNEMISQRLDYIWYTELGESLYLSIPGATNVCAYWCKEKKDKYYGEILDNDVFRIDISEIVHKVKEGYKYRYQYINLLYEEGRYRQLGLPVILRNVIVEPYFKLNYEDELMYMNINIKGNADLYIDIKDYYTQEIIVAGRKLKNGRNEFPELSAGGFYDLVPYMEEADEFGLDVVRTELKILRGVGYMDMNNLINCRLQIQNILFDEEELFLEYRYFVETTAKEADDIYLGGIFRVQLENGKENWSTKKIFGKVRVNIYQKDEEVKFSLVMYSKDEEDWLAPYYDRERHFILGCDNKLLDTTKDYDRFVSLDEDLTEYIVDTERLRRIR